MRTGLCLCLGICLLAALPARARHDPLNAAEIEQLRDVAQQPDKRLPLYAKYLQERVASLGQLHDDPRFAADRTARIHDLLEDVDQLLREMDDNIDVYVRQNLDLRKPLKIVIEMDDQLQHRLRALKQQSRPDELAAYGFALDNALASAQISLDDARNLVQEQEQRVRSRNRKHE